MKQLARNLRKKQTETEKKLWLYLRNRQFLDFKFRRQQIIGTYIVDFLCLEKNLVIELDGGQHQTTKEKDKIRTEFLNRKGFNVLRFWDNQVLSATESVLETIRLALIAPHPNPLPLGEGEREKTKLAKWLF